MAVFHIDCSDLYWNAPRGRERQDLCLHGFVTVVLGYEVLQCEGTVSATALYLLKTLTENHIAGEGIQMIPCCGHTLIPNEALTEVEISGCPKGIDWTVEHVPGGVRLTAPCGEETEISLAAYRTEVFRFADMIEAFYAHAAAKKPASDLDQKGYTAFWNEWYRRRSE